MMVRTATRFIVLVCVLFPMSIRADGLAARVCSLLSTFGVGFNKQAKQTNDLAVFTDYAKRRVDAAKVYPNQDRLGGGDFAAVMSSVVKELGGRTGQREVIREIVERMVITHPGLLGLAYDELVSLNLRPEVRESMVESFLSLLEGERLRFSSRDFREFDTAPFGNLVAGTPNAAAVNLAEAMAIRAGDGFFRPFIQRFRKVVVEDFPKIAVGVAGDPFRLRHKEYLQIFEHLDLNDLMNPGSYSANLLAGKRRKIFCEKIKRPGIPKYPAFPAYDDTYFLRAPLPLVSDSMRIRELQSWHPMVVLAERDPRYLPLIQILRNSYGRGNDGFDEVVAKILSSHRSDFRALYEFEFAYIELLLASAKHRSLLPILQGLEGLWRLTHAHRFPYLVQAVEVNVIRRVMFPAHPSESLTPALWNSRDGWLRAVDAIAMSVYRPRPKPGPLKLQLPSKPLPSNEDPEYLETLLENYETQFRNLDHPNFYYEWTNLKDEAARLLGRLSKSDLHNHEGVLVPRVVKELFEIARKP